VKKDIRSDAPISWTPEDGPCDPNDDAAVEAWWKRADVVDAAGKVIRRGRGSQKSPTKQRITIRLSPDVLDHFRSGGKGWQSRMDVALRELVKRKRRTTPKRHPSSRASAR
jgi:uncharacterized protein (DUF4415 family)